MFRVIIAGGRDFSDYEYLKTTMDYLLQNKSDIVIVSGMARGADTLGVRYAQERGYPLMRFPAQWEKFGRAAGYKRNVEMADNADALVVFWDGQSRGTKNMIEIAAKRQMPVRIKRYKKQQ